MMKDSISESELLSIIRSLPAQLDGLEEFPAKAVQEPIIDSESCLKVINDEIITHYSESYSEKSLTIAAGESIQLKVNNLKTDSAVSLGFGDQVTWSLKKAPLFELQVSDDAMEVCLIVRCKERYASHLREMPSCQHLVIELVENKNEIIESLNATDVMLKLQELKLVKNVDYVSILNEVMNPTYGSVIVARGELPTSGQDAELLLYFSDTIESKLLSTDETIDFRNHHHIPQVKCGDLIARKKEPSLGTPGFNVYGHVILPPPPVAIKVMSRKGVEIKSTGEIIALTSGRPKIIGQNVKYFDISKEHVVVGDVNMQMTGNISFSGDVIVYGNVMDNMIIESLGNVMIMGNVHQSTITATGSVSIMGNVTSSQLYSGYFGVVFNRLYSDTKKFAETLTSLCEAANFTWKLLESKGKSSRDGAILHALIQTKYHTLHEQIQKILQIFERANSEIVIPEWNEFHKILAEWKHPLYILNHGTIKNGLRLVSVAKQIYLHIELMQEQSVVIEIGQCTASTLKSNGDINVRKAGTIQSHLFAKNKIVFDHVESVCRGGELEAGDSVYLMAVGGRHGTETTIKANKKIYAKKIYMATVCIGKWVENIFEPLQNVTVWSEMGRLKMQGESLGLGS
jgi:uncharacterized protein (DUF342 family)